jgi:hypothetical protein
VTVGGWILMVAAWAAILGLTGWCILRIVRSERRD